MRGAGVYSSHICARRLRGARERARGAEAAGAAKEGASCASISKTGRRRGFDWERDMRSCDERPCPVLHAQKTAAFWAGADLVRIVFGEQLCGVGGVVGGDLGFKLIGEGIELVNNGVLGGADAAVGVVENGLD